MTFIYAALSLVLLVWGVFLLGEAMKVIFSDRAAYARNRRRAVPFRRTLMGDTPVVFGHGRDDQVSAGLAWETGKRKFKSRGRLSDEALDDIHP